MDSLPISSLKTIDLRTVHGAEYNPREIADADFAALKASLYRFGCIIPLIVNPANNTIIAGHQRTRAMLDIGITYAPCFYAQNVSPGDEMIFNQIHNRTEFMSACAARCVTDATRGFCSLPPSAFSFRELSAEVVMQICRLLSLYGNVLSCVVCDGEVVLGAAYARAACLSRVRVNSFVVGDADAGADLRASLSREYGRFSYSRITRRTYVQGLAQLNRSTVKTSGKKQYRSILYATLVLPYLATNKEMSVLDFGCGKGAYVASLGARGVGVEFYPHKGNAVDVGAARRMVGAFLERLRSGWLPDVVVCDCVLNSVDSADAERAVLICCSAFSKLGVVFLSGRLYGLEERITSQTHKFLSAPRRSMYFYDENLFSAIYRSGSWYFQHFHTEQSFRKVCEECGLNVTRWTTDGVSFHARCDRVRDMSDAEIDAAIRFEFSLPLPGGKRYDFADEAISAYHIAKQKDTPPQ